MALMLLASCGSKDYKVIVTFPDDANNGETVFLTNYDTGDTIATATVENKTCTLEGSTEKGFFARLYAAGNPYGFVVEPGEVKLILLGAMLSARSMTRLPPGARTWKPWPMTPR